LTNVAGLRLLKLCQSAGHRTIRVLQRVHRAGSRTFVTEAVCWASRKPLQERRRGSKLVFVLAQGCYREMSRRQPGVCAASEHAMWGTLRHISQVALRSAAGSTSLLRMLVVAASYFALAKGALTLASVHPSASPVWPPSGLALASFLLWGNKLWPAIAAGAFLANVTTAGSLFTSS